MLYRQTSESSEAQHMRYFNQDGDINVNQGGIYYCRGGRGGGSYPVSYTEVSDKVTIQETVSNKAVVTLQPNSPLIYSGETITVRCEIEGGGNTRWEYEWRENNKVSSQKDKEFRISASSSSNVIFMCKGRRDLYSSTEWSKTVTLRRSLNKAKPTLTADRYIIPVGGDVTLTCSVDSSADWKYYWFRRDSGSSALQSITNVKPVNKVSEGGIYQCRAGRGDPEIYTEDSRAVTVWKAVSNKAVVTLQPNWPEIYRGETVTIRCEIQGGGDTKWTYDWRPANLNTSPTLSEHKISSSGGYSCRGLKDPYSFTEWSNVFRLTVSYPPASVLTVSRLWLSPGDSVTLSCEVEHPSAGWRFYWYKTIPKLSDYSSIYELLPGSINGTEQDSYIIHGPTHTAGYKCRAGRGDPVYYTQYSKPGFVWSGDVHSAVTLKVSPDRVQHFIYDSFSLSCEGNFTKWRVRRFPEDRYRSDCYNWRSITGSTCNIKRYQQSDAVYWCESGSGEFSNAVNITIQKADIILVSPVHPVTEGQSVTLGCKLRTGELLSNVFFYQNDKLIQNDTRRELKISAVSKSDEGFYKCKYSGEESAQSWMSVKVSRPENSSSLIRFIVGLVCGVVLIILLILLYRYRRSKDSHSVRPIQSESTNQDSATHHMVNLNETQDPIYNSLLHGDVCVYESIRGSEDHENDSHSVRPIQSESTNQDSATHHMVNLNETQDHIYNSLLHGQSSN
ncbi:basement membrane-specific heparan sulfate proteoglycan core protein-like [Scomber scombrus]|uniref:Basement membrane-specific heparan sulfate proteoglycan core protein-like n=1 Tax=Scomber scombrus TaxID=13677 RepID=A0AAV1Q130_SCOSC